MLQTFDTAYAYAFIFTKFVKLLKQNKRTYAKKKKKKMEEPKLAAAFKNMPVFSSNNPELFFVRLEDVFLMKNISSQKQKNVQVTCLRDLLINPPQSNPYDKLKEELILRTSLFERRRLQQLLEAKSLGDIKSS